MPKRLAQEYENAWTEAKEAGHHRWHGPECHTCGATERYVSNKGACVPCQDRRAREAHEKHPLRRPIRAAKYRAERDGLQFNLVEEQLIVPDVCPVLGTSMEKPSLDRRDNSEGYTRDNVRVISWEANRLKHRLTLEQVKSLLLYMEE